MQLFFSNFIFLSQIYLFSSKEIKDLLYNYFRYNIEKDAVYHYKLDFPNNVINFQCEKTINLYCFDDQNSINKHFNGSYSNYIALKKGQNIIFDLNNTKNVDFFLYLIMLLVVF